MATIIEHRYVTSDERILGGEPVIKGTRTPVRAIVELWRMGTAPEDIPQHLPLIFTRISRRNLNRIGMVDAPCAITLQ
jgi:uncharacterized protein (DUF433 family)